jgi:DNA topoisomerase-3
VSKALVITEKPSVARDITSALGGFAEHDGYWESDDYVVTFAVGHLFELLEPEEIDPEYKRWTLANLPIIPEKFQLKKKSGQSERIRTIKKLLARTDVEAVVNACDAGREGELIFREIVEFLESGKPIQRLWLQSMTAAAIRDGFADLRPGEELEGLGAAAECRAYSDWLIGMNATRALTKRLGAWLPASITRGRSTREPGSIRTSAPTRTGSARRTGFSTPTGPRPSSRRFAGVPGAPRRRASRLASRRRRCST